jgi:hypothetical protein
MPAQPFHAASPSLRPGPHLAEERVRLRARNLAAGSAARLRLAATRAAGADGAALACALLDMIRARTCLSGWPVRELIETLSGASSERDAQVRRLLDALRRIEADIEAATCEMSSDGE